ncbi:hypothetical protein QE412_002523 [Microbacterium trichothecenolyticum]|uniref:Uncharacterized protein n=1 Tax=Microbacterium trichothecenolyticum TaxID=69370 RepID=A0ABU0TWC3_MICTR|nr:hypothetical protein [Microbacterium trichothecenolyticum]
MFHVKRSFTSALTTRGTPPLDRDQIAMRREPGIICRPTAARRQATRKPQRAHQLRYPTTSSTPRPHATPGSRAPSTFGRAMPTRKATPCRESGATSDATPSRAQAAFFDRVGDQYVQRAAASRGSSGLFAGYSLGARVTSQRGACLCRSRRGETTRARCAPAPIAVSIDPHRHRSTHDNDLSGGRQHDYTSRHDASHVPGCSRAPRTAYTWLPHFVRARIRIVSQQRNATSIHRRCLDSAIPSILFRIAFVPSSSRHTGAPPHHASVVLMNVAHVPRVK